MENKKIDYNSKDDYYIMLTLLEKRVPIEHKEHIINNYSSRIDKMDEYVFFLTFTQIDIETCERCNSYMKSKITSMDKDKVERLLYIDKYEHVVSPITEYLLNQEWIKSGKDDKYKSLYLAYELEKLREVDIVDKIKIVNIGEDIVSLLSTSNHDTILSDMIMKNYLGILKKHYPDYLAIFSQKGYSAIDIQIANNMELTFNMIIFDCHMMKEILQLQYVQFFEFYENDNDKTFASYLANEVRINKSAIKALYKKTKNRKVATQSIFFAIGHELEHGYSYEYDKKDVDNKNVDSSIEELKMFNCRMSESLQQVKSRSYYLEYHDSFSHEYDANIMGVKLLCERYKFLSSLDIDSKKEMNMYLANILFGSYLRGDKNDNDRVSPVQFTRIKFSEIKDYLPGYAKRLLLNGQMEVSLELEEAENNLTDYEKFLLGYYNPYLEILELIALGKITSVNLLDDLPILYEKYGSYLKGKYLPYKDDASNKKSRKKSLTSY